MKVFANAKPRNSRRGHWFTSEPFAKFANDEDEQLDAIKTAWNDPYGLDLGTSSLR